MNSMIPRFRSLALAAGAYVVFGACSSRHLTAADSAVGQFIMTGVDGSRNLPCCSSTDTSGAVVTLAGGMLQIGWNTPPGAYGWDITRRYDYPNGSSSQAQTPFSAGTYRLDGETLTLVDSGGQLSLTGPIMGNIITLRGDGHTYEFLRLVQLPH